MLTPKAIQDMAQGVREIARQKDPIGEILESWTRPSGIEIDKIAFPWG